MLVVRIATVLAINAQTVAIGWHVYDLSRSAFHLGLIGLVQFLPAILLILLTGAAADRFRRRTVLAVSLTGMACCSVSLFAVSAAGATAVWPYLAILTLFGTCRAFLNPAFQALVPNVVPIRNLGNAVALTSIVSRCGQILGPLVGGLLVAVAGHATYLAVAASFVTAGAAAVTIVAPRHRVAARRFTLRTFTAGLEYIWTTKPVLGAISLDVVAALLGGATALLPIFARDILEIGPFGLGALRGASALGGLTIALYLSFRSIRNRVGVAMLATTAVFGVATIAFGLSTQVWLSMVALFIMGGSDTASVFIRWTLVQTRTPDELRGRVSAVTSVSASGSSELGDFRAGTMAALIGAVPAVVVGGVATVGMVALWMRLFPMLVRVRHFERREQREGAVA
jgi:hypothetical protein